MTVATPPSTSPNCGHFLIHPPSSILSPAKTSDGDSEGTSHDNEISGHHDQPVYQHPLTELRSRQLVDSLLEEAERRFDMEIVAAATSGETIGSLASFYTTAVTTTTTNPVSREPGRLAEPDDEAVYGWERASGLVVRRTGAVAARATGAGGVRRKAGVRSSTDVVGGSGGTAHSSTASHGGVVRCVSEDYVPGAHSHRRASWKSNVEPGTYRYIVNNGIYRSTKFASLGGDWVTAKRSRGGAGASAASVSSSSESQAQANNQQYRASISGSGPRTSEVRHRQSMIRRDLNRYTFLNNTVDGAGNKRLQFEHSTIKEGDQSYGLTPSPANNNKLCPKDATGQADRCNNSLQHDKNQQQQQQSSQQQLQPPLPPWSSSSSCYSRSDTRDPQLVKSASDLFVENFSSKIDALEKEDPTAGTPDCLPRPGTNPALAMTSLQSSSGAAFSRRPSHKQSQNHLHPHDTSGGQSAPGSSSSQSSALLQSDDISRDVFTVRPAVGIRTSEQGPLKPLEKLTPQMQKKAQRGKICDGGASDSQEESGEGRSEVTSAASQDHPITGASVNNRSNRSTPLGEGTPPHLSTSFMTAMNAFSQIHHRYHMADTGNRKKNIQNLAHQSKSGPPTFRSTQSNGSCERGGINKTKPGHRNGFYAAGSGAKYSQYQTPSDTDSLSSVKNALTMTNSDIEKMRMNHLAVRDYNRYISTRPKPQLTGLAAGKPPAGNRKTLGSSTGGVQQPVISNAKTLGLRPFNTTSAPVINKQQPHLGGEDLSGVHSDSDTESLLTGTASLMASRGARERGMSLPEISGKRLSVTTSSQRML